MINEILYHPDPTNLGGEFIELFNGGKTAIDLSGWALTDAVAFPFSAGTLLPPDGYLVVAGDEAAAREFYGIDNIAGQYQGALSNGGELIVLRDPSGGVVDSVAYDDDTPWPDEADGGGPSLELLAPSSPNEIPSSWAIGAPFSPGRPNNPLQSGSGEVVITEIMYRPLRQERREEFDRVNAGVYFETGDDEFGEYVELYNRSGQTQDLSGWSFTSGIDWIFPAGTTLTPGAFLVVAASPEVLRARFGLEAVVGPFAGRLDNGGERLTLRDNAFRTIDTVRYRDVYPWPTAPDEFGVSLERIDLLADNGTAANWRASFGKFQRPRPVPVVERGWQLLTSRGTATSNRLFIYIDGPGEWLIDDIQVLSLSTGSTLEFNGSFEPDDHDWSKTGNHAGSFWTDQDVHGGAGCERIVATGPGEGSANSLNLIRIQEMVPGEEYSISFWVKYLSGHKTLTLRLSGGGLLTIAKAPQEYDLAQQWSDSENPSGPWSCRDGSGSLLSGRSTGWLPPLLGSGQPAWTNAGDQGVPGWCKSAGAAQGLDFPRGSVGTYGPSELWWIAPAAGLATIHGGVWLLRHAGSDQHWEIEKGGEVLASGKLVSGDGSFNSSSPAPFQPRASPQEDLSVVVAEGDVIRWLTSPEVGFAPDFVGYSVAVALVLEGEGEIPQEPPPIGGSVGKGTPGRPNSVASRSVPPLIDGVIRLPEKPTSKDPVTVTAKVTANGALRSVILEYTLGNGKDPSTLPLYDDGLHGDGGAADGRWGAQLPPQPSHTLVHYRIRAQDEDGGTTVFPYDGEPSPTFAYYHYDGDVDTHMTFFDLFITPENLATLDANPFSYDYVDCTLAIDGIAYPHIGVRYRGRGSRTHPKHPWKFQFNKVQLYNGNHSLETMLSIPFEQKIAFEVFDWAGIANLESELVRLHMNGQFWGVYIAFESMTASWLEKHGHDAGGEIYKARTVETPGQSKNSDLFHNQIVTDDDYWGAWNKKIRPLEQPVHIRDLTDKLNDLPDDQLLPWLDAHVDLEQWFARWALNILMNIDDFAGHNYELFLPGGPGGKWQPLAYDFDSGFTVGRVGPLRALYGDGNGGDSPDWQRNKFYQRAAQNPTLRRIYYLKMRELLETVYLPELLFLRIDTLFALTAGDRELDIARWDTMRLSTAEMKSVIDGQRQQMLTTLGAERLPTRAEVPRVDPPGNVFMAPVLVTLSAPQGWDPVYTLDGTDPRLSSTMAAYRAPVLVKSSATLKAAAIGGGLNFASGNWTELAQEVYEIHGGPPRAGPFVRGDCNGDGRVRGEVTDAIFLLNFSFLGGRKPACLATCDSDGDGTITGITDAIYLLNFNFLGGVPPPSPFPICSSSESPGDLQLGCEQPGTNCP